MDDTMRRRVRAARGGILLGAILLLCAAGAAAQQGTTIAISNRSLEVSELLQRGHQLEVERRWGEALTHYEDAVRLYPGETALQRRFESTRLHYDVARRYADRSFRTDLAGLSTSRALDLYGQVLVKIQAHYVEVPSWKDLVERGANNLEVALSEPTFVAQNLPAQDRPKVDEFRRELRRTLGPRVVASRTDARDAVALAAQLAKHRLDVSPAAAVMEFLCGAANALDPYSTYLTPDQLNEVYSQIDGNFVGLGIELKGQDGTLAIVRVIPGSPAEEGGLRVGDRILAVDGQSTRELNTDQAANLLQGVEGSVAHLSVTGPDGRTRELSARRRRVDVPSVDNAEILDAQRGIAYLKLPCFQKSTSRDLDAALWKLHREGMRSLIIDLRGNPGGLLLSAVEVADKFLQRGIIVSTRGRSTEEDFTYSAHVEGTWRVPLVLLIDQNSASAAEIFAGAIRDHRRGTIVGTRSYGKGSVQGIFPLDGSGAGLRLTTAKFYSPNGRPYSNLGVEPEVAVHLTARPIDGQTAPPSPGEDPMVAAALQAARSLPQPR
jgi:carboxyl-terminal processing protease